MTLQEAEAKAKRDCLILQEFLSDEDIGNHIQDVAGDATDYTAAIIDEAIINMLQAILPVAPTRYERGSVSITRESIEKTLREYQRKTGAGVVNLYRGDQTTWNNGEGE